jgi:hypothetical protein
MITSSQSRKLFLAVFFAAFSLFAHAQLPTNVSGVTIDNNGNPVKKTDSSKLQLQHRNPNEDSITISYHYFNQTKKYKIDSSISDFYQRYPVPWYYTDLGNFGNPAHSLLFDPLMKPGWDAGFHALDVYGYNLENTKFYNTTRPYTELGYLIGGSGEQMIDVLHTQNRNEKFNFGFEYRLISSPGTFKSQNSNHNTIRLNAGYTSTNKRYGFDFIFISNKLRTGENGGITSDSALTATSSGGALSSPFQVPTKIGAGVPPINPLSTSIYAGTSYKSSTFLLQQHYDIGQKDSLVTDSVTYKLFYPRLRFQHTFTYTKYSYEYEDDIAADSDYAKYFNFHYVYPFYDTLRFQDRWISLTNEFSLISYPQKNNQNQFLKLSAAIQKIQGAFDFTQPQLAVVNLNSTYVSAEYRNRTRNQKWDLEAAGQLYVTGPYTGDYSGNITLQRQLTKTKGTLEIGFQNVNRSPSYVDGSQTSFYIVPADYNKENVSKAFATISFPKYNATLAGEYYLATNYIYFDSLYKSTQDKNIFNVLHVYGQKKFALSRFFNFYSEVHLQQATPGAPVHLPLIVTRERIAFEGNFYRNLFLSMGLELIYNSPYDADNYNPLTGQFFYQNTQSISNRPDANVFVNFRIKSFKGFVRFEHVSTFQSGDGSTGFTDRSFGAPLYPGRTLWFRAGIWWNFVN